MRIKRLRTLIVLALGLATLAGLSSGGEALAQKKGGGGTPPPPAPGTIYYITQGLYGSMKGDGSGKVQSTGRVPTYQKWRLPLVPPASDCRHRTGSTVRCQ